MVGFVYSGAIILHMSTYMGTNNKKQMAVWFMGSNFFFIPKGGTFTHVPLSLRHCVSSKIAIVTAYGCKLSEKKRKNMYTNYSSWSFPFPSVSNMTNASLRAGSGSVPVTQQRTATDAQHVRALLINQSVNQFYWRKGRWTINIVTKINTKKRSRPIIYG